jgi:hypothetical protein
MIKKKKLIVIGSGITGCVTALAASSLGFEVELYEKDKNIGGILQDVVFNNKKFYQDCQYFNPEEKWFKTFIKKNCSISLFNHEKYSFSNIIDNINFSKGIAGLAIDRFIDYKDLNFKHELHNQLNKRLLIYPKKINFEIINWLKKNNFDPSFLSTESAAALCLKRVFFLKNLSKIKNLKKINKNYDNLIGLPDKILYPKKNIKAALPKSGYNHFFFELEKILRKKKIKVFHSAVIKPVWHKNKLYIYNRGKEIKNDLIFWSGNPTGLIKSYGFPLLDSFYIHGKNYYFNARGKISNNFYLQIFDKKVPISRIFFYKLNGFLKVTVETYSTNILKNEVISYCRNMLKSYFVHYKIEIIEENDDKFKVSKKYVLISNRDKSIISTFLNETKNSNLLNGVWLEHSRDEKINIAIKNLKKLDNENINYWR